MTFWDFFKFNHPFSGLDQPHPPAPSGREPPDPPPAPEPPDPGPPEAAEPVSLRHYLWMTLSDEARSRRAKDMADMNKFVNFLATAWGLDEDSFEEIAGFHWDGANSRRWRPEHGDLVDLDIFLMESFQDRERVRSWLDRGHDELDGRSPLHVLRKDGDAKRIIGILEWRK